MKAIELINYDAINFVSQEIINTQMVITKILEDKFILQQIVDIAEICIEAIKNNNKIIFAGNGGSAADCQHLAAELVSRLSYNRPGMAGIAITTDTSALTAIGNDYGYDLVFSRQIEAIGQPGDVLFAISTSGNSANILKAIEAANNRNIKVIGFTGQSGGKMLNLCENLLKIPSDDTPKVQECHILIGHIICTMIEEGIYGAEYNPKLKIYG